MNLQPLLSTNLYSAKGRIAVLGTCLPQLAPAACEALCAELDGAYTLCLEESHVNLAVAKLAAMLATGQVTALTFASVDRSPHCTQLHYIHHELLRGHTFDIPIRHFVLSGERLVEISDETIELSKSLARLEASGL